MFKNRATIVKKQAAPIEADRDATALTIQCWVRCILAIRFTKRRAVRSWQRVFDPAFKIYFWYNKVNGQSQWTVPKFVELFSTKDLAHAALINRVIRSYIGKMRARHVAHTKYTRFYDSTVNKHYWMLNETKATSWKCSSWLFRQEIPMPPEDVMLFNSTQKIRELENMLKEKDKEIKDIRKKRYEELEPQVLADRVAVAKNLERPKNMDEWTIDQLAAWLVEMKMDEYIPFVYANRVDGLLFISLSEDDWGDMGILNRFHIRKLQIILKTFRTRFQRKKDKLIYAEEDELLSEYAPSELSDMIAAEDMSSESEVTESSEESYVSEEEFIDLTPEQRVEKELDDANITIEVMVPGDGLNFPMVGDIARVRYVCTLVETGKIIGSTRNGMQKMSVEFVLGNESVIKGFDRAIPQMSIGERSFIIVTPEYAYGTAGLAPHIPPGATVKFDLTLLGFRQRSIWVKPLIQEPGLTEKPYAATKMKMTKNVEETGNLYKDDITVNTGQVSHSTVQTIGRLEARKKK